MSDPWFELITDKEQNVTQGDIITDCAIIFPPSDVPDGENVSAPREDHDVIIMTQACDIEQNKVDYVIVCPVISLDEILQNHTFNNRKERIHFKNSIRKGFVFHYYLLNEFELEDRKFEYSIVNLGEIYNVDLEYVNNLAKNIDIRLRLKPLFREDLSQALARTFMRIGLPYNIPEFRS